jgi:hypothetical protein
LSTVGVLLLGGCGVGVYFLVGTLTKNADEVNAFLRNVRDQQFVAAYNRLCPGVQQTESQADFSSELQAASVRGHGVTSFNITSSNTETGTSGSNRSAGGTVRFADGESSQLTFFLEKNGSDLCISYGYTLLW